MKKCAGYLTTLVQGIAFVIFVVQMIFAVQKYQSKPTVSSQGTKSLSDLITPVAVAVCKLSQFDHDRAAEIGYKFQDHVFSGQISTGTDLLMQLIIITH